MTFQVNHVFMTKEKRRGVVALQSWAFKMMSWENSSAGIKLLEISFDNKRTGYNTHTVAFYLLLYAVI